MSTYTFNHPLTALFTVPLAFLLVLLVIGLSRDFNFLVLFLALLTGGFLCMIWYFGFFRRLRLNAEVAEWRAPGTQYDIPIAEVRHFGTVKYRRFRFIFLSRAESPPFQDLAVAPVSSADTFVIQFRHSAWDELKKKIAAAKPQLQPIELQRR